VQKKIKQIRLQLKRTSSRETCANNKILKLEQNINENCCQEKLHRIQYLEHQLKEKENEINELTESLQYLNDSVWAGDSQAGPASPADPRVGEGGAAAGSCEV